jgi:hypothetical protein
MHPTLSQLLPLDKIPNEIEAVRDALESIFDDIYVKNLIVGKSYHGDSGFYSLTLTTYNSLGVNIPIAEDLKLVLNPTIAGTTEIPISFDYSWVIIKYIKEFSLDSFDNAVESVLNILFDLAETTPSQLLREAIYAFYPGTDSLVDFVTQFNNAYTQVLQVSTDPDLSDNEKIDLIADEIEELDFSLVEVIYETLINIDGEDGLERLKQLFANYFENIEENIKEAIQLNFNILIKELSVGLQFPHKWLRPVLTPDLAPMPGLELDDPLPDDYFSYLTFNVGSLGYSSKSGFEFNQISSFDLNRSMIGKTGLIAEFSGLKVDLSKDTNIPEAIADGRPDNFRGVYAEKIALVLPKKWFNNVDNTTLELAGTNILVGTGGISGTIALEAVGGGDIQEEDSLPVKIGNWELAFKSFDITFDQNVVTSSNIAGSLTIPKLKNDLGEQAVIDVNGHLYEDGDFHLIASEPDGITRDLFNFIQITFLSLELGREDDNFFIGSSCRLKFINPIMDKLLDGQEIDISRLRIYDNGSIEIEGGAIPLPQNISLNLGPVEIAVTAIHFGSHQQEHNGIMRNYNYWGFDGAISLDPLGVDARGEGIKYYYTVDNEEMADLYGGNEEDYRHNFLRVQTIEVDLVIPGSASPEAAAALIYGMVSIPEPGESPEYIGEVSLKLPKAKISGGAALRLQPRHPAFLLDAFIDFPAPIPLGPLGIYGFRGLLGFRYVAEKEAIGLTSEDSWYDYYTAPERGVGIQKFSGPERTAQYDFPFSIGAGAVLGTSFDSGTVLSMRMMLLLSMPSMFMLDGRASILSSRLGLDDTREPPFFFFTILGDNSLEFGMGADFQIPQDNGWILDLQAEVQAGFFFNNPRAWYVNFGTKDNPITARVLTIITAQSYLMLSASGIEAGSRVEIDIRKRFGPARVRIYAYLEMGGFISFERPQIGGYLALGGMIDINIWIVGVTIGLDALFSVEAARPFLIYAEIRLRVCVRIIFKVCKSFTIKMKWEKNGQVNRDPIAPLPYQNGQYSTDRTEELVQAIHMLTNEAFELNYLGVNISDSPTTIANRIDKTIPLDSYVDIKAVKGLIPNAVSGKIGGHTGGADNFVDLIPPQKVVRGGREIRQVKHKYSIEEIDIKAWTGNNWMEYHPYEALVPAANRSEVSHLRVGYWQRKGNQYDSIRLLATNPFSYMEAGEPGWIIPEEYGVTPSELFCTIEGRREDCADVLNKPLGTVYYPPTQYEGHQINGPYFNLEGFYETVVNVNDDGTQTISVNEDNFRVSDADNNFGYPQSLEFDNGNSLVIVLPEPAVRANLKLTTDAAGVTITYYRSEGLVEDNAVYTEIYQVNKTSAELNQVVEYSTLDNDNNPTNLIAKIVIDPIGEGQGDPSGEGTGSFCADLDRLNLLYQQCFVPVETSEQVDQNIPCFTEFGNILTSLVNNNNFPEGLIPEYNNYMQYLGLISSLVGHHEQILRFYWLDQSAIKILANLGDFGDCGCSSCEVLERMQQHFASCFTLPANASLQQLNDATACLDEILKIVNCDETVEPPKELRKTISFNYDSSATQGGQGYAFNLTELTSGNSSSNGIQNLRLTSLPNRGELAIISDEITTTPTNVSVANINNGFFFFWPTNANGNGAPGSFSTVFQFMIVDNSGNDTDSVTVTLNATDTYKPGGDPSLTLVSNVTQGPKGKRTQVFEVGESVSAGNKFRLTVYSHTVTVTALAGDTAISIASKLRDAINNTTTSQWNSQGVAPPIGTAGYPPTATSSGDQVTIVLNHQNQFAASASVS